MKIRSLLLALLLGWASGQFAFAQDETATADTTYWTRGMSVAINFNQASFSDNWTGGGVNSVALGTLARGRADYLKGKVSFNSEMELQYGLVNNQGQGFRKSTDRILLDTKLGYKISEKWNMFSGLNFLSQFDNGFDFSTDTAGMERQDKISGFMAPGFLTGALGFEYKPSAHFNLRLSPISPRLTFVTDTTLYRNFPKNYGVPIGQRVRTEWFAGQVQAMFNKDIAENLNLTWRYFMFINYEELAFNTIDHRLDLTITAKVTKFLNVNLAIIALYDKDQDDKIQYSQNLAIGVQYALGAN